MNFKAIESVLRNAGFSNIQCIPLRNLRTGIIKRADTVDAIVINGETVYNGGCDFDNNAKVIITYHSFS